MRAISLHIESLSYFSHHPLSADTSFKFLSLILFEIWHLQNYILIFSKGRNFTRGDNSKKKNASAIFPRGIHT